MKIGAITIGQAPRLDVTPQMLPFMGNVEVLEAGGLDGLTKEDVEAFTPKEGEYVLISKMNDGSAVVFAKSHILPRLQQCIFDLEAQGAKLIVFYCTGEFPQFQSNVPLLFPDDMLKGVAPSLSGGRPVAIVTPVSEQIEQCKKKWGHVPNVSVIAASPYGQWQELEDAAQALSATDAEIIVLDCIGYTDEMKELFMKKTGAHVILSRSLTARLIGEMVC